MPGLTNLSPVDGNAPERPGGSAQPGPGAVGAGGAGGAGAGRRRADRVLTVASYLALALFGAAQAVLGAFFAGSALTPGAAVGFDAAIFATCVLGGWGLRSWAGAVAPAASWFVLAVVLAFVPSGETLLIAGSSAGELLLLGGTAATAAGVLVARVAWPRRP